MMARAEPSWVLSRHLSVGAEYELHRIWFPERGQRFAADLARVPSAGPWTPTCPPTR